MAMVSLYNESMQIFKLTDLSRESTKLQANNKWGGVGVGVVGCV